jgi:hypothetical protein
LPQSHELPALVSIAADLGTGLANQVPLELVDGSWVDTRCQINGGMQVAATASNLEIAEAGKWSGSRWESSRCSLGSVSDGPNSLAAGFSDGVVKQINGNDGVVLFMNVARETYAAASAHGPG